MIFQSFHGSPGSPEDFFQLESLLGGTWYHQDRRQALESQKASLLQDSILVGYSWGCRELFRVLNQERKQSQNLKPQKVILISPFLFTEPVGLLKKVLLNLPGIGRVLISSQAETAVKTFLRESSHPQKPSDLYSLQKDKLKKTNTLRTAVLEKDDFTIHNIPDGLEALVIWGDADQTSSQQNQIDPLMDKLGSSSRLVSLPDSGHALPWNKAKEISEIIKQQLQLSTGGHS